MTPPLKYLKSCYSLFVIYLQYSILEFKLQKIIQFAKNKKRSIFLSQNFIFYSKKGLYVHFFLFISDQKWDSSII